MRLPIMMRDVGGGQCGDLIACSSRPYAGAEEHFEIYGSSGRSLLAGLLGRLGLCRADVISILTTSDDQYVSTCVSVTAFNYASISRRIEPATRVVLLVHEFGYAHPQLERLACELAERNIVLIEDCAHVRGLTLPCGRSVGSFGDYALFSLPKVSPVSAGGLLRTKNKVILNDWEDDKFFRLQDSQLIPYWRSINLKRMERYEVLRDMLGEDRMKPPSPIFCPFFAYVSKHSLAFEMVQGVEFGATLREDVALIPINPLVGLDVYLKISDALMGVKKT